MILYERYVHRMVATEIIETTHYCTIESTRVVNAPREVVYRVWSEPEHLKNWWGPAGFTNTIHEFDFREGGRWSFIMHGNVFQNQYFKL